jgi:ABC-type branched-subunit amino acid transport system permease subunit
MRLFFRKYLKSILCAFLSIAFLAGGCIAAGLLYSEENDSIAILLFVGGLIGAVGCIFFFYCCLRQISSKPKGPYISTLR